MHCCDEETHLVNRAHCCDDETHLATERTVEANAWDGGKELPMHINEIVEMALHEWL